MGLRLAASRSEDSYPEPLSAVLEETRSEGFRTLSPAVLDETHAPDFSVLTRFTGSRMLRGKIVRSEDGWRWHFVLDTEARHEGTEGLAPSYELAKRELCDALAAFHVALHIRCDGASLPIPLHALLGSDASGEG
jgi:hypothetical protein